MEQTPGSSSQEENDAANSPSHLLFQWSGTGHAPLGDPTSPSADENEGAAITSQETKQAPIQKRRRVTRACDECRRKKIKCDGKQPCTHCTVYSYGQ